MSFVFLGKHMPTDGLKIIHLALINLTYIYTGNTLTQLNHCVIIFTNPFARAGYDTRSIFKWSLTGLNSEFSFS